MCSFINPVQHNRDDETIHVAKGYQTTLRSHRSQVCLIIIPWVPLCRTTIFTLDIVIPILEARIWRVVGLKLLFEAGLSPGDVSYSDWPLVPSIMGVRVSRVRITAYPGLED